MTVPKHQQIKPGDRFGRWTIIGACVREKAHAAYPCRCSCAAATERTVLAYPLLDGRSLSCGCMRREMLSMRARTHGHSKERLYGIWRGMRERCANSKSASYRRYGGRGITVCREWQDYETFRAWALSHGYADDLQIDRIDNDGGYSPDNCQWASRKAQARNTSGNRKLTAFGETKTCTEWLEDSRCRVISKKTLWARLATGESAETAITDGPRPKGGKNRQPNI